jgi:SagB-type dehydrogenase family enzyme
LARYPVVPGSDYEAQKARTWGAPLTAINSDSNRVVSCAVQKRYSAEELIANECSESHFRSLVTRFGGRFFLSSFDKRLATMKAVSSTIILGVLATCLIGPVSASEPLEPIHLPPPETSGGMPLMKALDNRRSTKAFTKQAIPLDQISNLLWAAFGINRPESGMRTAATAVNCQDIEVYVVLEKAAYVYQAEEHRLIPAANRDVRSLAATQAYAKLAPINLVYVSDYSKMPDRFKDKKPIYAAFHTGSISQNVYLYCASEGLAAVVRDSVDRAGLRDALTLRKDQVIVMAQSVGYAPSP